MPDPSLGYDADLCAFTAASYGMTPTLLVGDLRMVMTERAGITYVAFPGTRLDYPDDWFTDLAAIPRTPLDHPEVGRCHGGIIKCVDAAFPQFADMVKDVKRLMMGGHSEGGGFALGMGAFCRLRGTPIERLTTFGALRVFLDRNGVDLLAPIDGRRYRNGGDDPVPELPPWPFLNDRGWTVFGRPQRNPLNNHYIAAYQASFLAMTPVLVPA
jgi:hypothetical protein